jgi:hypothetical protein
VRGGSWRLCSESELAICHPDERLCVAVAAGGGVSELETPKDVVAMIRDGYTGGASEREVIFSVTPCGKQLRSTSFNRLLDMEVLVIVQT